MNQYLLDLYDTLKAKYIDSRESIPFSTWVEDNMGFTTTGYEFQRDILNDLHPDLVVMKCSQVGLTEIQIRKILTFAKRYKNTASIFSLPNEKMFRRISQARLLPLIDSLPVFKSSQNSVRSMGMIQIDNSWVYVTGCTEGDATSIAADALFHDELDLSPPDIIGLFQSRLQNSKYKITQRFSTPTYVGYGVDKIFKISDQREYMFRCSSCSHWQIPEYVFDFDPLDFTSEDLDRMNMDANAFILRCKLCHNPLVADKKEWVPKYPSRTSVRGYRIRPWSTETLTPKYVLTQLVKFKMSNNLRGWYNTVMGEAYTDSAARISEQDIEACLGSSHFSPIKGSKIFVGIDMGQICHLVYGSENHIYALEYFPVTELVPRIKYLLDNYEVVAGLIDRYPYTPTSNEVRDISGKRILPLEYRSQDITKIINDEFGSTDHIVINRTRILDTVALNIRTKNLKIEGYGDQKQIYISHLRDMVRDERPDTPPRWLKLTGQDHYFHATGYFLMAPFVHSILHNKNNYEKRNFIYLDGIDLFENTSILTYSNNRRARR